MNNAHTPLQHSLAEQHTPSTVAESSTAPLDKWIERVLAVMASTYGARFADMWAGVSPVDMKREWSRKLGALKPAEIVRGIDSLGKYCPTLPEFIELCRPRPDYETAYREAVDQTRLRRDGKDVWSNPAIFWASLHISYFDLMNNNYAQNKSRWIAALDEFLARSDVMPVPEAKVALPPVGATHTPEVAQEGLQRIRAMLKTSRFASNIAGANE